MCLTKLVVNPDSQNLKKRRVFKLVKVVKYDNDIKSIESVFNQYEWISGKHKSSRETKEIEKYEDFTGKVFKGFHVFFDRKTAEHEALDMHQDGWGHLYILACTAYGKDYVCEGEWDDTTVNCAVYTDLTVEKREYERTLQQHNKVKKETLECV